jgi:hypothetical protein
MIRAVETDVSSNGWDRTGRRTVLAVETPSARDSPPLRDRRRHATVPGADEPSAPRPRHFETFGTRDRWRVRPGGVEVEGLTWDYPTATRAPPPSTCREAVRSLDTSALQARLGDATQEPT